MVLWLAQTRSVTLAADETEVRTDRMGVWSAAILLVAGTALSPAGTRPFQPVGGAPEAVTALLQDRAGFVWVGSREGLFRYDGFSFQAFRHDPNDARSLPDNAIRTLYEDGEGALWIGTNTAGLARLDEKSWTFERFRHDPADPASLSYDSVYAIAADSRGDLWIGTQRGLNRLERRSGRIERFVAGTSGLEDDYVAALAPDRSGNLYVGTVRGGLHLFDRETGRFHAFRHDARDPASLPGDAVYALALDRDGRLWVGTDRGLARRTGTGTFERAGPESLFGASPVISSLAVAPGAVWAGTMGQGLWRVDPATGAARMFRQADQRTPLPARPQQHRRVASGDVASDQIAAVLADRAGAVWTGTWGAGLFRMSATALLLASAASIVSPAEAGEESATAIAPARDGGAFVGSSAGALVRVERDRSARLLHRFASDVLSIAESADAALWVGTTDGLWRFDPATGASTVFRHDPSDASSIGPGWVAAVRLHPTGLWIGTGEGGLQRVEESGRVVQRFLGDDYVTAIVPDRRGTLWVGTRSGGLNAFDPASGHAVRYLPQVGRRDAIPQHYVTSIVEDARGRLWVGTSGGGFARADTGADGVTRFARFTASDGLVDDDVMSIVEDARGTLWIGTRRGISRFDPDTRAFVSWLSADGLPSAEFERGAAARAGGLVLLGSLRGALAVPDDSAFVPATASATVVTSIRTPSGERPGSTASAVQLRHGEWVAVELAVLDFTPAAGHAYAYRLDSGAPWIDLDDAREITFAGLAAGSYQMEARGRDAQGMWSTAPLLSIRVVPPVWGTGWFRALAVTGVIGAAVALHRIRQSALERRNRELVALDRERERSRAALAAAYERLGLLTRRLEAAKEEERGLIARELHDELGTNLTAVILNLQLLAGAPDPERARRRIQDCTEIVDRMVQRIRDISLDLRPPLLDEMGLPAALRGYLDAQAERTGLAIDMTGGDVPSLSPEVAITAFRATQEAVTNVIRHAGARRLRVDVRGDPSGLVIVVADDGSGFDVQATMAGPPSKALGLLGMQERLRLLGGEVRITSAPGSGTRVHLRLPLEVKP